MTSTIYSWICGQFLAPSEHPNVAPTDIIIITYTERPIEYQFRSFILWYETDETTVRFSNLH